MAKSAGSVFGMILLGGILGGYLGELLGLVIANGFFHDLFIKGFSIGVADPLVLNLRIIVFTIGLKIFVNLLGVVGMIVGLYYSR